MLVYKEKDDKSLFLAQAGFTLENVEDLEALIIQHVFDTEAEGDRENRYGTFYRLQGDLVGLNGQALNVITIWLYDKTTSQVRFITLKPWRKQPDET